MFVRLSSKLECWCRHTSCSLVLLQYVSGWNSTGKNIRIHFFTVTNVVRNYDDAYEDTSTVSDKIIQELQEDMKVTGLNVYAYRDAAFSSFKIWICPGTSLIFLLQRGDHFTREVLWARWFTGLWTYTEIVQIQ